MRVCYVASHAHGYDGWGRYTVEVIRAAQARGVDPILVTAESQLDPALSGVEHHDLLPPLFTRRFETPYSLLHAPGLRAIIATCDIVHCTVELYAPLVALARRLVSGRRVPYVQNAHGTWAIRPLETAKQRIFFAPAFRRADRLLILSHFTRDWMARLIELPPHTVLTGGVHPAEFAREVAVSLPDWASAGPVVLCVGTIKPRKGQQLLVEAAALLSEQFPSLQLVMIGGHDALPGYVAHIHKMAIERGLGERVHLPGRVGFDTLVAWYQRADVFALLSSNQGSSFEGLGLVYLEAAAAGTPAIGTRNCGAEEAIRHGETGLLVPQNDPQAAASALATLLADDDLRQQMGQAGRRHARDLSWDALGDRLMGHYADLLKGRQQ